jgi:hypothetical protein
MLPWAAMRVQGLKTAMFDVGPVHTQASDLSFWMAGRRTASPEGFDVLRLHPRLAIAFRVLYA